MWTTGQLVYKFRHFSSNGIDFLVVLFYYSVMKKLDKIMACILVFAALSVLIFFLFNTDLTKKKKTKDGIYAKDITISASFRSLTIYIGNCLYFKQNPYSITPSDYNMGVDIKILNYVGEEKSGASFADNCFKANETGVFYLKFEVKTAYDTIKYDKIKITVSSNSNECESVSFTHDAISTTVNETLNLRDYLKINNLIGGEIYYKTFDGKLSGSIFNPDKMGSYYIEVGIDKGDYLIFDGLTVIVNSEANIGIRLYDDKDVLIKEGDTVIVKLSQNVLMFSYIVDGLNYQLVRIEIENNELVSLQSSDAPIIVFNLIAVGGTKVVVSTPNKEYCFAFYIIVESA